MSSKFNSRRNKKSSAPVEPTANLDWHEEEILIIVKTYPSISTKYQETVCIAGITSDGNWIRLYPLKYRYLPFSKQFKKYQWVKALVKKCGIRDTRKESYRIKEDSIRLGSFINTKKRWSERKSIVLPTVSKSLEEIKDNYDIDKTSLGIFRPKTIDFKAKAENAEWKPTQKGQLTQLKLFGSQPKKLERIPFKFVYEFTCADKRCEGHKLSIHDWEIMQLYRGVRDTYDYAQDKILEKIKQKFLYEMWDKSKDSHLIVGSVYPKKTFIVVGVFWPPK